MSFKICEREERESWIVNTVIWIILEEKSDLLALVGVRVTLIPLKRILLSEILEIIVFETLADSMVLVTCHNWWTIKPVLMTFSLDPQTLF